MTKTPNPDVPSLKVCKRLEKQWRYENSYWAWLPHDKRLVVNVGKISFRGGELIASNVPAPTIGELLQEIRRRNWVLSGIYWSITNQEYKVILNDHKERGDLRHLGDGSSKNPADALARAFCRAIVRNRRETGHD
jgi:hypothetical protein